jgi:GrpB-like predicted nucleotidyltransferase (UPF0157 family)
MSDRITLEPHSPDWATRFQTVKAQLLEVLGRTGHGGAVWSCTHVGSTAVPGLLAKPVVDVCVEVYPESLNEAQIGALERLGFAYKGEAGVPGRQFFRDDPRTVHIHVYTLDSEEPVNHWLFRDYLTTHPEHAVRYAALKTELAARHGDDREAYTLGKQGFIQETLALARHWWLEEIAFQPVLEVAALFEGTNFEWVIGAGWALDLWLERVGRYHHDVDVLAWRDEQLKLRTHLLELGFTPYITRDGVYEPWLEGTRLELPLFQIHAYRGDERLDVMLMDRDDLEWIFRRDPSVRRELHRATLETAQGIHVLAPEIVLLFKSRSGAIEPRGKDAQDFERTVNRLTPERRAWLHSALLHTRPDHPWLQVL